LILVLGQLEHANNVVASLLRVDGLERKVPLKQAVPCDGSKALQETGIPRVEFRMWKTRGPTRALDPHGL
jgi:hypothetical protein